jgi:hypothetical protein
VKIAVAMEGDTSLMVSNPNTNTGTNQREREMGKYERKEERFLGKEWEFEIGKTKPRSVVTLKVFKLFLK